MGVTLLPCGDLSAIVLGGAVNLYVSIQTEARKIVFMHTVIPICRSDFDGISTPKVVGVDSRGSGDETQCK